MRKPFPLRQQLLSSAKSRAKKYNLPFNLELEDIIIPERCPLLGIQLKPNKLYDCKDSSPSLDRIIPSLGYVKGNIWVVSMKANAIKRNATVEELFMLTKNFWNFNFESGKSYMAEESGGKISFRLHKNCRDDIYNLVDNGFYKTASDFIREAIDEKLIKMKINKI